MKKAKMLPSEELKIVKNRLTEWLAEFDLNPAPDLNDFDVEWGIDQLGREIRRLRKLIYGKDSKNQ